MKKKMKIVGLEEALAGLPEEERALLRAEIEKTFSDFDPENPPGKPVISLGAGAKTCPACGGRLRMPTSSTKIDDEVVFFADCEPCDQGYAIPALS